MSRSSVASIVARMRGSSAGRKPTSAIIRFDASSSSDPNDCVKALAVSLQPLRHDGLVDLVAARCRPLVDSMARVESIGERELRAFERDPTHQLRVHEVARLAAYLPDPLIALVPALRSRVGAGSRRTPSSCGARSVNWSESR